MKKFASFVPFVFAMAFLVACGDDGNDFVSRPSDDSSSSECEDCSDESSSSGKDITANSSSSRKDKSSSSSAKSLNSSSAKSSSSVKSSSSKYVRVQCDVETDENCMKDDRDGQTYRTTKIGNRVWMAENLNYVYLQSEDVLNSSSRCYRDSIEYCEKYGRYYLWSAAMDSVGLFSENGKNCGNAGVCSTFGKVRGVCPKGWHVPSRNEWMSLVAYAGDTLIAGKKLRSTDGWLVRFRKNGNGTDAFGFSALPAGAFFDDFAIEGFGAYFWSSTEDSREYARHLSLEYHKDSARVDDIAKKFWLSVRCVMDDESLDEPWMRVGCKTSVEDNCEYGELTDDRDGQTYKTVKVGDQWWMAENLNYAYYEHARADSSSFCYDDNPEKCEKYGRLYWWVAAMDSAAVFSDNGKGCSANNKCSPTYPVRGICPEGWHLPDAKEWKIFLSLVGDSIVDDYYIKFLKAGLYLKFVGEWGYDYNYGLDSFGFTVRNSGYRYGSGTYYDDEVCFWSSKEYSSSYANYVMFSLFYSDAYLDYRGAKDYACSVRCLKDSE